MELGLGLSEADRRMLEENVSIVFHCAASVRFDDPLKYAIINNTRATREVMMLSRRMKNLKVSTCSVYK
jgi:Putative dehydrogenase domain of multifunctional non-ribosomal peptide synthetases and related enzymes